MRILFISNYYPPHEVGGYEQLCQDVAAQLTKRGHQVQILTSNCGVERSLVQESNVHRVLQLQLDCQSRLNSILQFFFTRRRVEARNLEYFRSIAAKFAPDIVFIWNLQGLPRSIAIEAESLPGVAVAYWLAGYSPAEPDEYWIYWLQPGRNIAIRIIKFLVRGLAMRIMRSEGKPLHPKLQHAGVVSEYMRRKGIAEGTLPPHARVIYNGVEVEQFFKPIVTELSGSLNLLQAGRVSQDKGVHTAVEAVGKLVNHHRVGDIHLYIAGSGPDDYLTFLKKIVCQYDIGNSVSFLGRLPREEMAGLMSRCHVLLLPSIHQEAFARVMLEAMASGLAVVGTLTGGTGELLQHEVTGLAFSAGDSDDLAEQINRLVIEPGLRQRLAAAGQKMVVENLSLECMVGNVEKLLEQALADRGTAASAFAPQ